VLCDDGLDDLYTNLLLMSTVSLFATSTVMKRQDGRGEALRAQLQPFSLSFQKH
jgi:hypothetical protein